MKNKWKQKYQIGLILCSIFIFLLCCGCGKNGESQLSQDAYEVMDSQGTVVKIPHKPNKILTLSMHTDIIALGMVTTDKMVGVNALLDDPYSSNIVEKAKKIPVKIKDPSPEQVFALKPDLIIASGWTPADTVSSLRELGFPVIVTPEVATLADTQATIKLIAQALKEEEKGDLILAKMKEELADIQAKVEQIPENQRKKIVLISLMTTYGGSGCTFDAMCNYAGVINGVAAAGIKNGQVLTKEMIVGINPDIFLMPSYQDHGTYDVGEFNQEYLNDPSLQTVTAIKNNGLRYPREGYIYNASQDFVYGVKEIAYAVYGDAFAQPANQHISFSGE